MRTDEERPNGLYFVEHDEAGHRSSYLRRGSAASFHALDDLERGVITRSSVLFASGISFAIFDRAADAVFDAVDHAHRSGGTFAFDTNYRPRLWPRSRATTMIDQALRSADVVFPGLDDMDLLLKSSAGI